MGLYLEPPERAVVLYVDEKSQIQALARFQPILPMMPGTPERRSHDYVRHGTTSLFVALDMATGQGHRLAAPAPPGRGVQERSSVRIDEEVPEHLAEHLILDNNATHKTPDIQPLTLLRHRLVPSPRHADCRDRG